MHQLADIYLFERLNPEHLEQVARIASTLELPKGQLLFGEGDSAAAFFAVLSGKVKIFRMTEGGAEFTVHIHGKGDLVAEAAIFDLKRYPAYCIALEDSTLVRIQSHDFVELIHAQPGLSLEIMHGYSKRLRQFVRTLADMSMGDVKARLANYLIRNARAEEGRMVCRLSITKRELSGLLGTVPETLSRTLRAFKDKEIIAEDGTEITILQPAKLRALIQN